MHIGGGVAVGNPKTGFGEAGVEEGGAMTDAADVVAVGVVHVAAERADDRGAVGPHGPDVAMGGTFAAGLGDVRGEVLRGRRRVAEAADVAADEADGTGLKAQGGINGELFIGLVGEEAIELEVLEGLVGDFLFKDASAIGRIEEGLDIEGGREGVVGIELGPGFLDGGERLGVVEHVEAFAGVVEGVDLAGDGAVFVGDGGPGFSVGPVEGAGAGEFAVDVDGVVGGFSSVVEGGPLTGLEAVLVGAFGEKFAVGGVFLGGAVFDGGGGLCGRKRNAHRE